MQLSKGTIEEYKEIYKKKTGKKISDEEAFEMAGNLLRLFKAIYRPIPRNKAKEFKK